jgi:hypothetical protein
MSVMDRLSQSVGVGFRLFAISFLSLIVGLPFFLYSGQLIMKYSLTVGFLGCITHIIFGEVS